jgi:3-oxoadipate enol-lactonase
MLAYFERGTGSPVVLLHGQGGEAASWSQQLDALAARHRVIAVDLRGHGRSPWVPGRGTMEGLANDVAELGLGPTWVVGHSLGGMVALQLALSSPGLVRGLVMVNASACGHGLWVRTLMIRAFLRTAGMKRFASLNAKLHFPREAQGAQRERLVAMMGSTSADAYLAAQEAVDAFDVRERLGELKVPVGVVHSDEDLIPLAEKELIVARVPQAKLVRIPESRHVPLWDQPERLSAVLLELIG